MLQIAAHVDVVVPDELYEICRRVRDGLGGAHAVGRVIARPFTGAPGAFERTDGRRDYSLAPPTRSYLQEMQARGVPVHTVGKVGQLFSGVGIDEQHPGATNAIALAQTRELLDGLDQGLVFTNLIETDQVYGHRHDVAGFHAALREIDAAVGEWLALLRDDDLLILTADHGCDVTAAHTDHTREYAPLLACFVGRRVQAPRRGDGRRGCERAQVAYRRDRGRAARRSVPLSSRVGGDARATRGRDDPPPAGPASRGPYDRARSDSRRALDEARCPRPGAGRADRRPRTADRPLGQVPDLGAFGRAVPARPPADDRCASVRS